MTAQSNITPESIVADLRYLQLLSRSFPTIAAASRNNFKYLKVKVFISYSF